MTIYALLFTLAAIGISETVYLIQKRKALQKPICILGEECGKVLESKYNKIFLIIHNDVAGLLFYIATSFVAAFLVIGIGPVEFWNFAARIMIFGAVLMSLLFIYIQWRVIKSWCFWCVLSAITIFLMAIIIFL